MMISIGNTEAINLTAAQYLSEANNPDNTTDIIVKTDEQKEVDEALKAVEEIPSLQEEINPLLEKISKGLSGMSKVVGGSTKPHHITPGMLATFLSTKQSNEQDIIVHLRELHLLVTSRLPYLQSIRDHQTLQLSRLDNMINKLEERMALFNERRKAIETNFKLLSQRSTDILCAARDLTPTITEAERAYFRDIQRYETDCTKFEEKLNELRVNCRALKEGVDSIQSDMQMRVELTKEQVDSCYALLEGKEQKMKESEAIIKSNKVELNKLLIDRGIKT